MMATLACAGPLGAQNRLGDGPELLVRVRVLDSVRAERERVARFRGEADGRASTAESRQAEAAEQVELLKREIEALDQRLKSAKKDKREADKTAIEADKKDRERRRNLWEKRRDLRAAEVELARSEVAYCDAATRALDLEQQLERKRGEAAEAAVVADLERKTLEGRLAEENRRKDMDDRRVKLVERQLDLAEAQVALSRKS